ncbi:MAG: hypothetical protein D6798_00250 [Deltaproteobacteria bacterium]|nr:MAG: hypothetical protein D6798_00250 [Deltaproteobacteria bacterium]
MGDGNGPQVKRERSAIRCALGDTLHPGALPMPDRRSPAPPMGNRVRRVGDRLCKQQDPAVAAVEADKSRRARAIGEESGLFRVPPLVEEDRAAGRLVFAWIPDLRPLQHALADDGWEALCDRAATALRAVHEALRPDPALRRDHSLAGAPGTVPIAALHGDFSPSNVLVQAGTGDLWIIDWAGASWLDPRLTHGPISIDLATFVLPLFWQRPRDPWRIPAPARRARRFLEAYADGAADTLDLRAVGAHCIELQERLLPEARRHVSRPGALARWPLVARSRWFFRRLPEPHG